MIDWEQLINALGEPSLANDPAALIATRLLDQYTEACLRVLPSADETAHLLAGLDAHRDQILRSLAILVKRSDSLAEDCALDEDAIRVFVTCGLQPIWSRYMSGIRSDWIDLLSLIFLVGYQLGSYRLP